ncbi:hypothetical protein DFA_06978 [Cavenderia fasciculata]|uniref:Uncharacterized protein n=1 Tax=Cavenderia fasciculata TaxID=261658 RepID=F4PX72_CACFS|nr:uncharacterized protein DFA_06978 [Cavenderia fasciculata]EGG19875.1 hypothetical protein DFA_06978 [Cavenderia fasciculata]|eukprot:XP_004366858.1 hypothetical protein DFA_06978 [Cavenderia fasciculata]
MFNITKKNTISLLRVINSSISYSTPIVSRTASSTFQYYSTNSSNDSNNNSNNNDTSNNTSTGLEGFSSPPQYRKNRESTYHHHQHKSYQSNNNNNNSTHSKSSSSSSSPSPSSTSTSTYKPIVVEQKQQPSLQQPSSQQQQQRKPSTLSSHNTDEIGSVIENLDNHFISNRTSAINLITQYIDSVDDFGRTNRKMKTLISFIDMKLSKDLPHSIFYALLRYYVKSDQFDRLTAFIKAEKDTKTRAALVESISVYMVDYGKREQIAKYITFVETLTGMGRDGGGGGIQQLTSVYLKLDNEQKVVSMFTEIKDNYFALYLGTLHQQHVELTYVVELIVDAMGSGRGTTHPNRPSPHMWARIVLAYLHAGKMDDATKIYKEHLCQEPEHGPVARQRFLRYAIINKDVGQALEWADANLVDSPILYFPAMQSLLELYYGSPKHQNEQHPTIERLINTLVDQDKRKKHFAKIIFYNRALAAANSTNTNNNNQNNNQNNVNSIISTKFESLLMGVGLNDLHQYSFISSVVIRYCLQMDMYHLALEYYIKRLKAGCAPNSNIVFGFMHYHLTNKQTNLIQHWNKLRGDFGIPKAYEASALREWNSHQSIVQDIQDIDTYIGEDDMMAITPTTTTNTEKKPVVGQKTKSRMERPPFGELDVELQQATQSSDFERIENVIEKYLSRCPVTMPAHTLLLDAMCKIGVSESQTLHVLKGLPDDWKLVVFNPRTLQNQLILSLEETLRFLETTKPEVFVSTVPIFNCTIQGLIKLGELDLTLRLLRLMLDHNFTMLLSTVQEFSKLLFDRDVQVENFPLSTVTELIEFVTKIKHPTILLECSLIRYHLQKGDLKQASKLWTKNLESVSASLTGKHHQHQQDHNDNDNILFYYYMGIKICTHGLTRAEARPIGNMDWWESKLPGITKNKELFYLALLKELGECGHPIGLFIRNHLLECIKSHWNLNTFYSVVSTVPPSRYDANLISLIKLLQLPQVIDEHFAKLIIHCNSEIQDDQVTTLINNFVIVNQKPQPITQYTYDFIDQYFFNNRIIDNRGSSNPNDNNTKGDD